MASEKKLVRNGYPSTLSCYTQDNSANCGTCKYVVAFGNIRYCGYCPPRCTLHEIIKDSFDSQDARRRCIVCKYYHKKLSSECCFECLKTENLKNFAVQKEIETADWYKHWGEFVDETEQEKTN